MIGHIHLTADDRLDPCGLGIFGKFQRTKEVVGIRHRHGRHVHILHHAAQFLEPHRPFKKRVFGVDAKMDKSWTAHLPPS